MAISRASSTEPTIPEPRAPTSLPSNSNSGLPQRSVDENRRFNGLRSVEWRINLGILPSSSSSSIDDYRRVTADSRRSLCKNQILWGPQVGSLDNFSKNILVGKGQVTAMAALKELRKISNLLSEM